jgi:acetolactate synthase I/II/III large subunit
MIKVTDYVVRYLEEFGITDVFMVTGGGAMHLNDSFGKSKKIRCICNHHEQASAIAAEGYARQKQALAVVNVTTGPGGLNTLNGVLGQWTDSVPVLYISGQVRLDTTVLSCPELNLRQLGDQEVRIVDCVRPITKYAVTVTNPKDIRKELEMAIHIATTDRPGPVWLDIPMNIQGAMIDEADITAFHPEVEEIDFPLLNREIEKVVALLLAANRPVIVAGHGIRLSKSIGIFKNLIKTLGLPVLSTLNGFDLMENDHPLSIGTIGSIGSRAGNFAIQNADLVLFLGTRNNIRQISYNWAAFARAAKKVCIDIDPAELNKPFLQYDLKICADLKDFLPAFEERIAASAFDFSSWLTWCIERKNKYQVVLDSYKNLEACVNPYYFMEQLSYVLPENAVVVTGDATACICYFQAGKIKKGQRIIWNSGCASMGYDLPAAIGACIAEEKDVVCLAGDGSLQMNIQELMTLSYHRLPIKLFYLNNDGYISMKQTQDNFFGRRIGANEQSGVGFPDIIRIAQAYDLKTARITSDKNLTEQIASVLQTDGPLVCEVVLPKEYAFAPKLSSERKPDGRLVTKPLEDMFPFLDREEFKQNMLIPIMDE